ncbi:MAG TPA: hypothetical protein GXZ24_05810 [Firmicutes bacterium]|jgi:septal ring factor EnvC (AmiA/AmiB activator)|nr:hypothetical protein [Bacillota bacterium]
MNGDVTGVKAKKRVKDKRLKTALSFFLLFLLWVGIALGGYFYALNRMQGIAQHFSDQVGDLLEENERIGVELTTSMQLLRDDMQQLKGELGIIQEELELAGESITGTDSTRQGLQERMGELDKQLAALRDQLRRLEDATRAF